MNWDLYVLLFTSLSLSDTFLFDNVGEAADEDRIQGTTFLIFLAWLFGGVDPRIQTMSADLTLVDGDMPIQSLNTNGAARKVIMPATAANNHIFLIWNRGAEIITVRNSADTVTIITVSAATATILFPDGVNGWVAVFGGGGAVDLSQVYAMAAGG